MILLFNCDLLFWCSDQSSQVFHIALKQMEGPGGWHRMDPFDVHYYLTGKM